MTVLLLLIPAFFLGWFFPSGLRILAQKHPDLIPWAWGINGRASVIGAVLGKCLPVSWGFDSVILIASLLDILAVASFHMAYRSSSRDRPESASAAYVWKKGNLCGRPLPG
jgi:hypothetical protein